MLLVSLAFFQTKDDHQKGSHLLFFKFAALQPAPKAKMIAA